MLPQTVLIWAYGIGKMFNVSTSLSGEVEDKRKIFQSLTRFGVRLSFHFSQNFALRSLGLVWEYF